MNAITRPQHALSGAVALLDGPLVIVDVGAQALAHEAHVYEPLRRLGVPLRVIGFEPLAEQAAARRAADGDDSLIVEAFVGDGGTHRFHPCNSPASSSLFPLDRAVCGTVASLAGLVDRNGETVATQRLDDLLAGIEAVDFLKLDIEGAELMTLQGATSVLARTAVIHAETAFVAFRTGQPLFADIDTHLREQGFGLIRLHEPAMRAAVTPSGAQGADRLMWADAVFFANEARVTDRMLLAQAIVAGGIYRMHTVAERALAIYDVRHGTGLAADYVRGAEPDLLGWTARQTNTALSGKADIEQAVRLTATLGLPAHPDRSKCWDGLLATVHAARTTARDTPVLDAGAERYSTFLPGLRRLGFTNLTGINTVFDTEQHADGITFRHGDVTGSGLPGATFGFIACLSVIEHGVDLPAFFREQARLLRPGGHLFVSCDYWETPVDTAGQSAYGTPVHIFTQPELDAMIALAASAGLAVAGPTDFSCGEKPCRGTASACATRSRTCCFAGPHSSPAPMLTANARMTVLNRNEITPCAVASRRISRDVTCTSDTWNVIPSTIAK